MISTVGYPLLLEREQELFARNAIPLKPVPYRLTEPDQWAPDVPERYHPRDKDHLTDGGAYW